MRPLSDGSNPWSTSLVKSQKSVPLAALFAEQGEHINIGRMKYLPSPVIIVVSVCLLNACCHGVDA